MRFDPRNVGGRKLIMDEICNHTFNLRMMKPTIDIRSRPPRHISRKKRSNKFSKRRSSMAYSVDQVFRMKKVEETFNRIRSLKRGTIDQRPPRTLKLKRKLKKTRKCELFIEREHLRNLACLEKNMSNIGSVNHLFMIFDSLCRGRRIISTRLPILLCFSGMKRKSSI